MKKFDDFKKEKPNVPEERIRKDREEVKKLTDEEILQEQLEFQKNIKGYETNCVRCKGRGYIPYIRYSEDGVGFIDEYYCECKEKGKSAIRLENAHIPMTQTLDNFQVTYPFQQDMMNKAKSSVIHNTSLMVMGQNGAGKTHLCNGVLIEHANKGEDVEYFEWVKESQKYTYNVSESKMNRLYDVEVLYIDDLFKASKHKEPSEAELKLYYTIINTRSRFKRTTLVTSEHSLEKLREFDKGTTDRLVRMCFDNIVEIGQDENKNYRAKHI